MKHPSSGATPTAPLSARHRSSPLTPATTSPGSWCDAAESERRLQAPARGRGMFWRGELFAMHQVSGEVSPRTDRLLGDEPAGDPADPVSPAGPAGSVVRGLWCYNFGAALRGGYAQPGKLGGPMRDELTV